MCLRIFQHKLGWDAHVCRRFGGFADDCCPFLYAEVWQLLYSDASAAVIVQEDAWRTQMIQREMRTTETESFDCVLPSTVTKVCKVCFRKSFLFSDGTTFVKMSTSADPDNAKNLHRFIILLSFSSSCILKWFQPQMCHFKTSRGGRSSANMVSSFRALCTRCLVSEGVRPPPPVQ